MKLIDLQLSSLLFITPLIHLLLSPHTKVEESFNLQATHDILVYGTPTHDIADRFASVYDHFTFPGAVPRTFIGAVVLSGISQPLVWLAGFQHAQIVVRAVLGAFNAGCLLVFREALETAFGRGTTRWWIVLVVSQFHVVYYLTRTLPNMFAFGMTTLAFAFILPKSSEAKASRRKRQAIICLVFSAAVFRAEIAILLTTTVAYLVLSNRTTLWSIIPVFGVSFLGSLLISIPIDSFFWQKLTWPELAGFYYNAIQGSSSEWGVSPWHYYFSSALPRLLLNPLTIPLVIFALVNNGTANQARQLAIPSLAFVAIYSIQPHKEARFIFYAIPPLTAVAALGANYITTRHSRTLVYRLATYALVLSVPFSLAISAAMLVISSLNYPGGDALTQLQNHLYMDAVPDVIGEEPVPASIHADVLTCMTGLTLFNANPLGLPLALATPDTQSPDPHMPLLMVDKTERNITLGYPRFWERFDYALVENAALPLGSWEVVGVVSGFDGIEILRPGENAGVAKTDEVWGDKPALGLGVLVEDVRRTVRGYTGGWWIGPRMSPRINIMRQFERL